MSKGTDTKLDGTHKGNIARLKLRGMRKTGGRDLLQRIKLIKSRVNHYLEVEWHVSTELRFLEFAVSGIAILGSISVGTYKNWIIKKAIINSLS